MRLTPPVPFLAAALPSMILSLVGAAAPAGDATGAAPAATAQGNEDDRVLPQESKLGIDALLSRETARMRESLASAALGSDHSMLLARKRSTDWSFLAAAVTARIGAGINDPQQLLSSIVACDASTPPAASAGSIVATLPESRDGENGHPRHAVPATPNPSRCIRAADIAPRCPCRRSSSAWSVV